MTIVVFTHLRPERALEPSFGLFERASQAARDEGLRVIDLPWRAWGSGASGDVSARDALAWAPEGPAHGFLIGPAADLGWYAELESAASELGIRMINTADANAQAMRFELFYEQIAELTARSWIVEGADDPVIELIDSAWPVFTKGSVASQKHRGLQACLAADRQRVRQLAAQQRPLIVRELLDLRTTGAEHNGMPVTREYRLYVLDQELLGQGFYWAEHDPLGELTAAEQQQVTQLALEAAGRLDARMLSIDVGQLADQSWRVIEVGDIQHTGIGTVAPHVFWRRLAQMLSACA
jgi:hypothetical protein